MLKKYLAVAFLAFSVSQVASAATVSYSSGTFDYFGEFYEQGSYGVTPTVVTGLQQFNPGLGTLTGVSFTITSGTFEWDAELSSDVSEDYFIADMQADLLYNDGSSFLVQTAINDTVDISCTDVGEGCLNYGLGDFTYPDDAIDSPWALNEFDINDLVGMGDVSNLLLAVGMFFPDTTGNAQVYGTMDIRNAMVQVTYDYSVVPVPAAVWLFGSGLLGLVGIARRKRSAM